MFLVGWLVFGEEVGLREAVSALLVLSAILAAPAIRAGQGPSSVVLRPG
ncbi:hypothetical protein QW131_03680 [Roseibium salinum]|nr:hypothetical protein [Roseibium salinum]